MAATTTFKPSTDDFGKLTFHATILGEPAFGNVSPEIRQANVNLLLMLAFFITLIVGGIGLYKFDTALFAHPHTHQTTRALAVDYN